MKYLRPTFNICYIIHKYSGIGGFDTLTGAHITPETELLWEDIVKSNPKCGPFKYEGWPFWDKMLEIMGSPIPKGVRVYRAGAIDTSRVAERERAPSPLWDIEDESKALPDECSQVYLCRHFFATF